MEKLKNIIKWTKLKIRIHSIKSISFYFYEREIWWASIGSNVGFEQDGKNEKFERPILVLKKFNSGMLWALPMTSKQKIGKYFYTLKDREVSHVFILPQIRLISSKRLIRNVGKISRENFDLIKNELKKYL